MKRHSLNLSILTLFICLVYSQTLDYPFVFDDIKSIRDNNSIQLTSLKFENLHRAASGFMKRRAVANLSFAFNYYFAGHKVKWYRLTNIAIHLVNSALIYYFILLTLSLCRDDTVTELNNDNSLSPSEYPSTQIAFFTSLIWMVHPIQIQSVTYIVQRMNSLAVMFYLMSIIAYILGRQCVKYNSKIPLFLFCCVFWVLAIRCKEIAATLPFVLILYEWYFFRHLDKNWLIKNLKYIGLLFFLILIFVLLFLEINPLQKIDSSYNVRDFTLRERVFTELRVVIFYITLLFFPNPGRLNLDHHFVVSTSLFQPEATLLCLLVVMGILWLAYYFANKNKRILSFSILWFFLHLLIESSVIGIELVFEHRLYLPSIGVAFLFTCFYFDVIKTSRNLIKLAPLGFIVFVLSTWAYQRNQIWESELSLWSDCTHKSPNKARPHFVFANALIEQGRIETAFYHYNKALKIRPDYYDAHVNVANQYAKQKLPEKAIYHYLQALKILPKPAIAHYNLGTVLMDNGRVEEAISNFKKALEMQPDFIDINYNLGNALLVQEKFSEAEYHFSKVIEVEKLHFDAYCNLGIAMFLQGKVDEAITYYLQTVKIKPDHLKAYYNLGIAKARQGKFQEAIIHYRDSLQINPNYVDAHNNLGLVLAGQGKLRDAIYHYKQALIIDPHNAITHNNLGAALIGTEKYNEAITHFSETLSILPNNKVAKKNLEKALHFTRKSLESSGSKMKNRE